MLLFFLIENIIYIKILSPECIIEDIVRSPAKAGELAEMTNCITNMLNLSLCKYLIELEPAVSYAIQTQRHGRLERADSVHDTVFVTQLIASNSWDEIMMKSIEKKEKFDMSIIKGVDLEIIG